MEKLKEFQEKTGYTFRAEGLLRQALTHSSYANEHNQKRNSDNERLEFLGDAVLEIITSEYLFNHYPDKPEGECKLINVIGEGKLANIAAGDGHPAEIMDLSFAVQAMSAMYIKEHAGKLPNAVIDVSAEIDDVIARRRLDAWGIEIDSLTPDQESYLNSWQL